MSGGGTGSLDYLLDSPLPVKNNEIIKEETTLDVGRKEDHLT